MGTIYKTLRGVGAGTATITASDGTNSASAEITSAAYEIVPYLYSDAELTQPISGTMLDLSTGHKYVEITVEKDGVPQEMGGDISFTGFDIKTFGYAEDAKHEEWNVNWESSDSVPAPHGGLVYEIYDTNPGVHGIYGAADFGTIRITVDIFLGNIYQYIYDNSLTYSRTGEISNVSVNSGNAFNITGFNIGAGYMAGYIPVSFTRAISDDTIPIYAEYVDNDATVQTQPIYVGEIEYLDPGYAFSLSTTTGQAGTGQIKYAYSDGTQIVESAINASVVEQLVMQFDNDSFTVANGNTATIPGTYTPATLTQSDILSVIQLYNYAGLNEDSLVASNGVFGLNVTATDRNSHAYADISINKSYDLTDPDKDNWQSACGINGTVTGEGYDFSPHGFGIPVGGTLTLTYTAYDSNDDPILTESTITTSDTSYITIGAKTFNATTGEGTVEITAIDDGWVQVDFSVSPQGTPINGAINFSTIDGIVSLTVPAGTYTLSANMDELHVPFSVTPTTLTDSEVENYINAEYENDKWFPGSATYTGGGDGYFLIRREYEDDTYNGDMTIVVSSHGYPIPSVTRNLIVEPYQPE